MNLKAQSQYRHSNPLVAWRVLIQLDMTQVLTNRVVYGIFEVLGDVGGFTEAIIWLAAFLTAYYTEKSFIGTFLGRLFKVEKKAFEVDLQEKKAKK